MGASTHVPIKYWRAKVKVSKSMNVMTPLQKKGLQPGGVARLGESGEECVLEIKKKIKTII